MTALVYVLILSAFKELSFGDSRVLLGGLVDRKAVVGQVEGNNEASVHILRNASVEASGVTEDLLVVIDALEEVALWLVGHKFVNVTKGVNFISESVVGRNLDGLGFAGFREFNLAHVEVHVVLVLIELLSVLIDTSDTENSAESVDLTARGDFITSQVVVTNHVLSRLVNAKVIRQSLSSKEKSEGLAAVVRVVYFTNFDGVVSQVVVDNERQVFAAGIETENLAIMIEELFLGCNLATSKRLLEEFLHLTVTLGDDRFLRLLESVARSILGRCLLLTDVLRSTNKLLLAA